jgi:CheY-like chemotaxis protein
MPGVDGIEALQLLKSAPITSGIPVVMVTAYGGPMEITLATHHGAEGYVTKPFEPADLLSLVQRFTASTPFPPAFGDESAATVN